MNERSERVLAELGIKPLWRLRAPAPAAQPARIVLQAEDSGQAPAPAQPVEQAIPESTPVGWAEIVEILPGDGDRDADCLLVMAPHVDVSEFSGFLASPAGKLLDAMLASVGLKRGEGLYLACLPGDPMALEACQPYLARMLDLLRPKLIVALGQSALFAEPELRGLTVQQVPHPADLLREPGSKAHAWEALCRVQDALQGLKG